MRQSVIDWFRAAGAYKEALEWLRTQKTIKEAWQNCPNEGWMRFAIGVTVPHSYGILTSGGWKWLTKEEMLRIFPACPRLR